MADDGGSPPKWSGLMRAELSRLPETAANIREASENLKRVSEELIQVSAVLNRVVRTMEATGMIDGLARIEELGRDVDEMKKFLTPPTSMGEAVGRAEEAVENVTRRVKGRFRRDG